ncbi:MAG: hypothetical protein IKO78_02455 [Bacilli bacterium]|nr:hypothetical protein [Bacilli bacterium]
MALSVTTIGDINSAKGKMLAASDKYTMALEKVKNIVIQSESSWNSLQAKNSREQVLNAINNELVDRKGEMMAQIKFLDDTAKILTESQEEIQNTLA